ncbi:MAG: serine protease-like protein [Archaeoglobales archaeon]|nr:serine protease-like protein [Archaeoglobales archaeon]
MQKMILALVLLTLLITPVLAIEGNSVTIRAVAVTSGEVQKGVLINITATITNGSGKVFISTGPYAEIDMQGSARIAAITACDLLGIDFTNYDFFYSIEADAPIVGGPSAGGVMTIATIAALKNLSLRDDVFMTGMIYPDGFIGPVGGLKYKLEAVANSGGRIFLIPEGQSITYEQERVVKRVGIINIVSTRYVEINLVDYGKKLGVDVFEVSTINDALKFYTGYEIKTSKANFSVYTYSEMLRMLAERMRDNLKNYEIKGNAAKLVSDADNAYNAGNYYTATSKYFQAMIEARYQMYLSRINNAQQFDSEVANIRKEIDYLKNYLKKESLGINSIQIIAAAQERIGEAELYLEKAQNSSSASEAIYNLAYARERVESAKVWLSLLNIIKNDYEISYQELKKRAEFYISEASSLIIYAESLSGNSQLISWSYDSLTVAKKLFSEGMYAGAAFSAVDSIVESSLAIEASYTTNLNEKVSKAKQNAENAVGEAEKSLTPILPAAYFEYAENVENPYLKLMYFKLSERLAKLLTIMAKSGGEVELVHSDFVPQQKSAIEDMIKEIPGFEIVLGVSALLAGYKILKRRD